MYLPKSQARRLETVYTEWCPENAALGVSLSVRNDQGRLARGVAKAHAVPVTALGRLIERQRELLGEPGPPRSYQEIANKATEAGYPLSKSGVAHLATKPLTNVPPTATILGLSKGLGIAVEALVDAALESCGLLRSREPGDPYWQIITARESQMTERQREAVRRQVAAALNFVEGERSD